MDILYVVVPCYNEEEVLHDTAQKLYEKMKYLKETDKISAKSRIVFVDDGSKDSTWSMITELHNQEETFQGLKLSRNKGHQNALLAGLLIAKDYCDFTISLDADLQDDINAIDEMIDKYYQGCEIVYGVRNSREKDTVFKKTTAESFYKLMNSMDVELVYNHADYRLMSKKAVEALESFKEVNLFLRGIVPMIGYKTDVVYYERKERLAGVSKYPLKKMISFAWQGITSLSTRPIKFITGIGTAIFLISILILIYSFVRHWTGATEIGWTSMMVSIWAIGGLQLLSIGIIGEYIGKVYLETKERPKYIIEKYLNDNK